jgi:uncharacterized protein (DUF433 family)
MSEERKEIARGITVDKDAGFGKAEIKGTSVEVSTALEDLASGAGYQDVERNHRSG